MATSVRDLLTDTLVDIGVLAAGETAATADADFAFRKFNRMLDTLKTERLTIYTVTRTTKVLTANDGEYSVGSGGDINIDRPIYFEAVNLLDTTPDPDNETALIKLTEADYAALPQKALTASQPSHWYYNPTFTSARGTLTLWPVPTTAHSIALYVPTPVDEFASLNTDISLPPGYREMLSTNLALRLLPSYGRQPDPLLIEQAEHTKMTVKRANKRLREMILDPAAVVGDGSRYDILSDRVLG